MRSFLFFFVVLATARPLFAQGEPPRSSIDATSWVRAEQDGCLDHGVKDLGMSAKREGEQRLWRIGPQFLHPSIVPAGGVQVRMDKAPDKTVVRVTASWPGAPKAAELQATLEERVRAIAAKLAQNCGVIHPELTCTVTPAGGSAAPCPSPAPN